MDQKIINITFHQGMGHMTVVLDEFFPTDATRLRKLLSIIDEDYEHRDELRAVVVQHCGQRARALMDGRSDLANQAVNCHTKATELQPEIDKMTRQVDAPPAVYKDLLQTGRRPGLPPAAQRTEGSAERHQGTAAARAHSLPRLSEAVCRRRERGREAEEERGGRKA